MNSLFQAGLELQQFFLGKEWPFCFIGGLAVIRWGEVRMTQDIDLSLFTEFGNEETYINSLLEKFNSRITDPIDFAKKNRVLLLSASNGVSVDISLAGLLFEQQMIKGATSFPFSPECFLITCSAEDLVVLKAFADRARDWMDVEGIIMRQGNSLDLDYIIKQLTPFCELKEAPEIVDKLKNLAKHFQEEG
ncbi:MAG: nucleotidyl transferase AbiEii/AbiGii toxin family protein [Proteobacteria bacterium]|nr:nucleotidyl transferase AbiEii/AbiGii toxin family protein [Pseudomonadota bacterium]